MLSSKNRFGSFMSCSFFKCLVCESVNHKGGERGTHSMHRHARHQPTLGLPHDHSEHTCYVVVGGCIKRLVRKVHGVFKKLFMVHGGIVRGGFNSGHSYFPRGCNVSIVGKAVRNRIQYFLHGVDSA